MNQKALRLLALRIGLGLLIVANLFMIFFFSSQNATESGETSKGVSDLIARIFVRNYEQLSPAEQTEITEAIHPLIRKLAHMAEFGLLGALTFCLLLTWSNKPILQYAYALSAVFAVACIDELGQSCSFGRASQVQDVLIDLLGAILTCSLILLLVTVLRHHRQKSSYTA